MYDLFDGIPQQRIISTCGKGRCCDDVELGPSMLKGLAVCTCTFRTAGQTRATTTATSEAFSHRTVQRAEKLPLSRFRVQTEFPHRALVRYFGYVR